MSLDPWEEKIEKSNRQAARAEMRATLFWLPVDRDKKLSVESSQKLPLRGHLPPSEIPHPMDILATLLQAAGETRPTGLRGAALHPMPRPENDQILRVISSS